MSYAGAAAASTSSTATEIPPDAVTIELDDTSAPVQNALSEQLGSSDQISIPIDAGGPAHVQPRPPSPMPGLPPLPPPPPPPPMTMVPAPEAEMDDGARLRNLGMLRAAAAPLPPAEPSRWVADETAVAAPAPTPAEEASTAEGEAEEAATADVGSTGAREEAAIAMAAEPVPLETLVAETAEASAALVDLNHDEGGTQGGERRRRRRDPHRNSASSSMRRSLPGQPLRIDPTPEVQDLASIRAEHKAIKGRLREYEIAFEERHGRKPRKKKDWAPVFSDFERYASLRETEKVVLAQELPYRETEAGQAGQSHESGDQ